MDRNAVLQHSVAGCSPLAVLTFHLVRWTPVSSDQTRPLTVSVHWRSGSKSDSPFEPERLTTEKFLHICRFLRPQIAPETSNFASGRFDHAQRPPAWRNHHPRCYSGFA